MRAVAIALVLASTTPAFAGEETGEAAHEEHEHHHHENHVAVFLGATTFLGDMSATHFTIGADYERRLTFINHMVGAGVLVDSSIGDETETLIAGFVAVHPVTGLMLLGGVGTAFTGAGDNAVFAVRGSAAYFFPVGTFSVGPVVSIDHANGESAIVYGVSGGAGF
jgi:hypothetical protein